MATFSPQAGLHIVLGSQWGDEGKGKLVDILSEKFDCVARATGGANAGHSVYVQNGEKTEKFVFHLLPSGILYSHLICVVGNGVAIHLETLFSELASLESRGIDWKGRLMLSERASLLFEYHKIIDGLQEDAKGDQKIGTTKRGIGPCYSDKINRRGIRVCDLADFENFKKMYLDNLALHQKVYDFEYDPSAELESIEALRNEVLAMSGDAGLYMNKLLKNGKSVLIEGANAALLDIDHGTYPYVTSSSPTIGGAFSGTGVSPKYLRENIGVVKAYTSRVGSGPFPSELTNELGEKIRQAGNEFGSTTGRPRRCGWLDLALLKHSIMLNGFTSLNLTKLDVLDDFEEIPVLTAYKLDGKILESFPARLEDLSRVEPVFETLQGWEKSLNEVRNWDELPEAAKNYVLAIEKHLETPISSIGIGQRRDQLIVRN